MFMIRAAEIQDLSKILEIYNEQIEHSFSIYKEEKTTLEERENWLKQQKERYYPVIIAESLDNKELMGYASFGDFRNLAGFCYVVEHSIYIASSHRQKGIARALMEALCDEARKCDKKIMIGAIDSENRASIKLHEKLGFEERGYLEKIAYKFGTWRDLVLMQKRL